MFDFNFNWDAIADFNTNFNPVVFEQEVAALANVVTVAVVNSPVVVNTPVNVAPAPAVVQPVVQQVVESVAPIIAPTLSPTLINKLEKIITEQVVSSPAVIASPAGVAVEPKAVEAIVSSVGTAASSNTDFVKTVVQDSGIDLTNQKADTLKATDAVMAATQPSTFNPAVWRAGEEASMVTPAPITVTAPSTTAAQESGTIGAASIASRQAAADAAASAGIVSGAESGTIGAIRTEAGIPPEKGAGIPVFPKPTDVTDNTSNNNNSTRPPQPGSAWVWDEKSGKWIKPDMPTDGTYTWDDNKGWIKKTTGTTILTPAEILAQEKEANERRDAFKLVESTMRSYGFNDTELKEILDYINKGLLNPNLGPNQLVLELRNLNAYKTRFAGNETRRSKGLNALTEAEYLQQENAYSEVLRQYGVQRFSTREQFASLIGNDISNTELGKRVNIAVNRVQQSDPTILTQLKQFYNITDSDIVAYYLNPKEMLPELEAKTTQAEIGSAAAQFNLNIDLNKAKELQQYGVDLAGARAGYEEIASRLPRAKELSDIYKQSGIKYDQAIAEQETFKGTASAKRARERLKELETGAFSGAAGRARTTQRNIAGLL